MKTIHKKILIVILMGAITYMHYTVAAPHLVLHIIHRELYFIPILLASYWFGRKFGLTVSITCSLLFSPQTLMNDTISVNYTLGSFFEVFLFNGVAYLLGGFQDIRKSRFTHTIAHDPDETSVPDHKRTVLACVNNSENDRKVAQYIADHFLKNRNIAIKIIGFIREPSRNMFSKDGDYQKAMKESADAIDELVKSTGKKLMIAGFSPDSLTSDFRRLNNESMATKILEELQNNRIDTIVVGGTRMTKAEEFVLGNIAVKLVRAANCPVVTVY